MIRLLLLILTVVLVWILFFSSFEKRTRIIASITLFAVSIFALWFDSYLSTPRDDVISLDEVVVCGLDVKYSYRTNYRIELCLQNNHPSAHLRRVSFDITAQVCASKGQCTSVQTLTKSRPVDLGAGSQVVLVDSMSFEAVEALTHAGQAQLEEGGFVEKVANDPEIVWTAKIVSLKGI